MGMITSPAKCIITGFPTQDLPSERDSIDYLVKIYNDYKLTLSFVSRDDGYKELIEVNRHIFRGLILNKRWNIEKDTIINKEVLESSLNESYYPNSIDDKRENIFMTIVNSQKTDGYTVRLLTTSPEKYFFKSADELRFYLNSLKEDGYLEGGHAKTHSDFRVTFKGLKYAIQIQESGQNSKNCFIAMSFDDVVQDIRDAIKSASRKTGFNPILVDEQHPESDQTVNDKIVAEIKKCKFLIADFTQQRAGVYFEAGYAAGRGLSVIYSCREEDFKKSHFDTNHFGHIIYKTPEELKEKLIDKIEAWIK